MDDDQRDYDEEAAVRRDYEGEYQAEWDAEQAELAQTAGGTVTGS